MAWFYGCILLSGSKGKRFQQHPVISFSWCVSKQRPDWKDKTLGVQPAWMTVGNKLHIITSINQCCYFDLISAIMFIKSSVTGIQIHLESLPDD
jgi:hypothetical protein